MKILFYILLFVIFNPEFCFSQEDVMMLNKYKVRDVEFEFKTTKNFDNSDFESIIKTGNSDYFNFEDFVVDVQRIEKFYFDNGYIDASVDTTFIIDTTYKEISVKFLINENEPYYLNNITYSGIDKLESSLKTEFFQKNNQAIKQRDKFNKNKIDEEISRIVTLLNNNGYAFAYASPPEIVKIESKNAALKNKINLTYNFITGKRYLFGKTEIQISKKDYGISLYDILRELDYKENNIYNKFQLIESENRLNRIALLDNARIQFDRIDTIENKIHLKIVGSVRKKYELQPAVYGYDISNRFFAGVGLEFVDKYFFGNGRNFNSKISILAHSTDVNLIEFSANLFQPYIFKNNKITANWNITGSLFQEEFYRITRIKNDLSFNYELPKYTFINDLTIHWKVSNARIKAKDNIYNDTIVVLPVNTFINTFSSILGVSVVHNSSNNLAFPSAGYFQAFLLEESGLIGRLARKLFDISTFSYFKFSAVNKLYFNISKDKPSSVIATKLLIGALFEYGDNSFRLNNNGISRDISLYLNPDESKFIAGGSTSIRGWGAKKLGAFANREFGGNFLIEGNIEHRTKPFINTKGIFRDLGFVTFFDYGNLWENPSNFVFKQIALAIGAGLRYYTIVGPFRFDFGFKLYDYFADPGTNKWLFNNSPEIILKKKLTIQFGIGNTF